jgi:Flp pilus assembly protein TadD
LPNSSSRLFSIALTLSLSLLVLPGAAQAQEYVPPGGKKAMKPAAKPVTKKATPKPAGKSTVVPPPPSSFLGYPGGQQPPVTMGMFNEALKLTQAKKFAQAEKLYKTIVKADPLASAAWANLALLVAQTPSRNTEAIGYMQKATATSPKSAPFWAQLSSLYSRGKRWKDAEAAAQKAIAVDPKNDLAIANLAGSLFQQNKFKEAAPLLRGLYKKYPKDRRTEVSLIFALRQSGQAKEALDVARVAVVRMPQDVTALLMKGDVAGQLGLFKEARDAYVEAYNLQPNNIPAGLGSATATMMAGDKEEAYAILTRMTEKYPNDPAPPFS